MANIQLSDHFSVKKLLKFTTPSIIMVILYSSYILADGLFISNCIGPTAYAAVNLVGNYILLFPAIGMMLGSGGAALIGKLLGENRKDQASDVFSAVVLFSVVLGIVLIPAVHFSVEPVMKAQGAEGALLGDCLEYGHIAAFTMLFYLVQSEFQYFFSMVEKEELGFVSALICGVLNISLDALFIIVFDWGLTGAAIASLAGVVFGAVFPILYFIRNKDLSVRLHFAKIRWKSIIKCSTNGISEMINNLSVALVGMLYNIQLMRYSGEDAVAAYGAIQAVCLIFAGVFQGYAIGVTPVIAYQFGADNKKELVNLIKKSMGIMLASGIIMLAICQAFAGVFAGIFVGYDKRLAEMVIRGMRIYSSAFILMSVNIFSSALYTALNDGLRSGILSLGRTFVFLVPSILILPVFLGLDGIWLAVCVAEILAFALFVVIFLVSLKNAALKEHR